MPVARDIKRDVNPLCISDSGIDFVLQPVFRNLLLDHAHVPRILRAKISAASCDSESTFCAGSAKRAVRSADRAAFSKRHLIALGLGFGRRTLLRDGLLLLLRFDLGVLALNLDRVR